MRSSKALIMACLASSCLVACVRVFMSSPDQGTGSQDGAPDATKDSALIEAGADTHTDADSVTDALADGGFTPSCIYGTGAWRLGPVERMAEVSSPSWEGNTWVTADGLTLYLSSGRPGTLGGGDLWEAKRDAIDDPFAAPINMAALNSSDQEESLTVSDDGLTAVLCANRGDTGGPNVVWSANRINTDVPWRADMFAREPNLVQLSSVYDPELSADGLRLYYAWHPAGGSQQIFVAERPSRSEPFAAGVEVEGVDSGQADADPTLSADERVIVFASMRPGGLGDSDLWYARRSSRGVAFDPPQLVPNINSAASDGEAFLSADGCELYFASRRAGGSGSADIYRVRVLAGP